MSPFAARYLEGKAEKNLNEEDIARALGYKDRQTLRAKRNDPTKFTIGELLKMADLFHWGMEDIVVILRGGLS